MTRRLPARTIAATGLLLLAASTAQVSRAATAAPSTTTTPPASAPTLLPRLVVPKSVNRPSLSPNGSSHTVQLAADPQPGGVRVSPLVRPGMRLTFWAGSRSNQNPAIPAKPDDVTGSAAAGYTQVNIVDVVGDVAVVQVRQYLPDSSGNGVYTYLSTGSLVSAAKGGDFWKSPAELAAATAANSGGVDVQRMTYPLDGRNYRAIRFTATSDTATFQSTYDLDTGVMLAHGEVTNAARSSTVVQLFFKGARQLRLPWTGERAPAAVQGLRSMDFQGTDETAIDGAYTATSRLTQHWDVTKADAVSMSYRATSLTESQYSAPQRSTQDQLVPLPGIWLDPRVLAKLRTGMVLDNDPITGVRQSVLGVQNGVVIIGEQAPVQASAVAYDQQTGLITAVQTQLRTPPATRTIFVQRTG